MNVGSGVVKVELGYTLCRRRQTFCAVAMAWRNNRTSPESKTSEPVLWQTERRFCNRVAVVPENIYPLMASRLSRDHCMPNP
jgi:hypothetical protein